MRKGLFVEDDLIEKDVSGAHIDILNQLGLVEDLSSDFHGKVLAVLVVIVLFDVEDTLPSVKSPNPRDFQKIINRPFLRVASKYLSDLKMIVLNSCFARNKDSRRFPENKMLCVFRQDVQLQLLVEYFDYEVLILRWSVNGQRDRIPGDIGAAVDRK